MNDENNYGPAIAVAIIVVILFFGGWYVFFGQGFNGETGEAPLTPEINASATPIVYGTSTQN
jgi:NADH:ubiquinone oxidoreductase subunit H